MVYLNEDGTTRSSYNYDDCRYDCQPYTPPRHEYDRGYDDGKMAVVVGAAGLGAILAYFIMKSINEK